MFLPLEDLWLVWRKLCRSGWAALRFTYVGDCCVERLIKKSRMSEKGKCGQLKRIRPLPKERNGGHSYRGFWKLEPHSRFIIVMMSRAVRPLLLPYHTQSSIVFLCNNAVFVKIEVIIIFQRIQFEPRRLPNLLFTLFF